MKQEAIWWSHNVCQSSGGTSCNMRECQVKQMVHFLCLFFWNCNNVLACYDLTLKDFALTSEAALMQLHVFYKYKITDTSFRHWQILTSVLINSILLNWIEQTWIDWIDCSIIVWKKEYRKLQKEPVHPTKTYLKLNVCRIFSQAH